jgi:hypothetical protein
MVFLPQSTKRLCSFSKGKPILRGLFKALPLSLRDKKYGLREVLSMD